MAITAEPAALEIEVFSDVVCPWCYIGKRRLEEALHRLVAAESALRPTVRWRAFQLNPDLPPAGIDRKSYLAAKFGSPARAANIYDRVRSAGNTVGIDFAFDRIMRQPNTRDAHRLVAWAQQDGRDTAGVVERLFAAYFLDGRFIGEIATLCEIAHEAGLDAAAARAYLASDAGNSAIAESDRRARALGVTGVPFFIVANRVAVSGAQTADVLCDAIAATPRPPGLLRIAVDPLRA